MLSRDNLHDYQLHAEEHLLNNPAAGLFMEPGLGKTITTLSAIEELINNRMLITKVLVVAPKKVAESVWKQEAALWSHTKDLRFSLILGDERSRKEALRVKADIYVINRENLSWLVSLMQGRCMFDMLVLDESSSFKNEDTKRFRAVKAILPALKRKVILTGTPMPNTLLDLWSQLYILDQGARLGDNFTKFKLTYFAKDPYKQFSWSLIHPDCEKIISEKIGDICISLQEKDYLKLPPRIDRIVEIPFSQQQRKLYEEFEKDRVLTLFGDTDITAINAAALTNKLLQYANGAIYDEDKNWHEVHGEKLDRLEEIIEDAAGHPVLVFYTFQHDLARIQKRLDKMGVAWKLLKSDKEVQSWNKGEIPVMLAHPASAGHGLNLQGGGNIVIWYGLNWSLELYDQGKKRVHRQGQKKPVIMHHLLIADTMDMEVWRVLNSKAANQESLMQAVKAKIISIQRKLKKIA